MKNLWKDAAVIAMLFLLSFLFFFHLFFPEPKLLVTQDFGRSDAWHSSFAAKSILSQSLQQGEIPLWEPRLGGGFPILADGLIGALFLPNLILFRFLPPVYAYNVLFVLLIGLSASGTFAWMRLLGFRRLASVTVGVTFGFSGIIMGQLTHLMLLPALSLLPWMAAATAGLVRKPSRLWGILLACITGQQILSGFPQVTFITLLFCTGYVLFTSFRNKRTLVVYFLSVSLGFMLSAVQLLPSYEYLAHSSAEGGFNPVLATYYSFPVKHFATFIQPFVFGNPKFGTYPHFLEADGSLFWENIGFFGILPLLLALAGIFMALRKGSGLARFLFITLIASGFLMTGKHSPLYIIFSLWPFHLFRVPSRFISTFVLSLLFFAGYAVARIRLLEKPLPRAVFLILLIANTVYLSVFWHSYHGWSDADAWTAPPDMLTQFDVPQSNRIVTLGAERIHNEVFTKTGWSDVSPYAFFRNTLSPNTPAIWNRATTGVYAGRSLRRPSLVEALMNDGITISDNQATISAKSMKFMNMLSGSRVIVTAPAHRPELTQLGKTEYGDFVLYLYNNEKALPQVYLSTKPLRATTVQEAVRIMSSGNFIPGKNVLMETYTGVTDTGSEPGTATLRSRKGREATIAVSNPSPRAVLVFSDTYYPGWEATIDGLSVPVLAANIRDKAVVVGVGDHTIRFRYNPLSFRIGAFLTLQGIALTIVVMVFPALFSFPDTVSRERQPERYLQRNHDR